MAQSGTMPFVYGNINSSLRQYYDKDKDDRVTTLFFGTKLSNEGSVMVQSPVGLYNIGLYEV